MLSHLPDLIAIVAAVALGFGWERSGRGEGIEAAASGATIMVGGGIGMVLATLLAVTSGLGS